MANVKPVAAALGFFCLAALTTPGADQLGNVQNSFQPKIFPASGEAELALKKFKAAPGLKIDLFAAEPMLANPVCFAFDEKGRVFVVETFRLHAGVTDIRGHMNWLDDELASTNTAGLEATFRKYLGSNLGALTNNSERVQLLEDRDGDGKADASTVFAEGFDSMVDGLAAGVLARKGDIYLTDIPNLWLLRDTKGTGNADFRKAIHYGFGVRAGFLGHDLHGLRIGPDGKIYFSIGDRGANIATPEGKRVANTEYGAVYRCNLDGSGLEIFAFGLRNPQELAFDHYGNLFTGDNNSDAGDPARWVYLVEGGDSGWRVGYQFIERPKFLGRGSNDRTQARGPWLNERQCYPQWNGQAAFLVPPIDIIGNGPSGLTYYPGVGLPPKYENHFFLADFKGSAANSLVHSIGMKQNGAGFEVTDRDPLISNVLVTDVEVGPDCRVYISDWVDGWAMPGKGRLYRVYDDGLSRSPLALETKKIIAEGMDKRSPDELAKLLAHPDQRVRQEAQFALADRAAVPVLAQVAQKNSAPLARLHAVWGLGQIAAKGTTSALDPVLALLSDNDAEVVAQAAKILGDARSSRAYDGLVRLLPNTQNPRGQFFAALGLGKLGQKSAVKPIYDLLRNNADRDVFLRHAGVMGLVWINDVDAILAAAKDNSAAVRMASLLALRRLERPEVANFLKDAEPKIVLEAARAINDASIFSGLPQLAQLVAKDGTLSRSAPSAASHRAPELELPLWRRVINANFRLGQSDNATALARLVAQKDNPLAARAEAMQQLGEWAKPSGRDTLTGLWRPLSPRDPKIAADALRPVIAGILKDAPNDVRLQAAESVGKLGVKEAGGALFELVSDKNISAMVRVEALRALAALIDKKLADAIKIAAADSNESLRVEAVNLQARLKPANATDKLVAVLERGTVGEQQNALTTLGTVEGSEAERILGEWLDKMMAGKVPPALQVDLLEAAGKRPAPAIKDRLKKYQESLPKTDDLAPYRIALVGGNAAEGKKIFFEKPEASCVRCHKVGEEGGEVGPVLTGVASRNPREYLLESVVFPNKQIAKGFETLIVSLKNGTAYAGIVKSEDDKELVLNSPEEGLVKIKKADIEKRDTGLSGMPEGLGEVLSKRDLRDLIEFLGSQK